MAERIAIASYTEIIDDLGSDDPTTRIMIEQIMAKEEENADHMQKILEILAGNGRSARAAKGKPI